MKYQKYYEDQIGSSIPIFYGAKNQRGYGLGSMFKSFFRWVTPFKTHALPLLRKGASTVGTEAVKTASNILTDTISGKDFEESFKSNAKEAINNLATQAEEALEGKGSKANYKKRKKKPKKRQTYKKKRKLQQNKKKSNQKKKAHKQVRRLTDIFDKLK
jgi:hypothetical protein